MGEKFVKVFVDTHIDTATFVTKFSKKSFCLTSARFCVFIPKFVYDKKQPESEMERQMEMQIALTTFLRKRQKKKPPGK